MGELTKLPNIAAKLEKQLADVGITTIAQLESVGSRDAWLRILAPHPGSRSVRLHYAAFSFGRRVAGGALA